MIQFAFRFTVLSAIFTVRSLSKAAAICKKAVAVRIQMNSTAEDATVEVVFQ